jgi:hypothetical protein
MFFGKNKTSLKLVKQHPELLLGCDYYVVENAINPKKIKIGLGLTKLYLKNPDGEEYLIEGNASTIKEFFVPAMTFENLDGKLVKIKQSVGPFHQNEILKEIGPCQYDEKLQLGIGITEQYYIQKYTNKVIKIYGNSKQIKNLFEDLFSDKKKTENYVQKVVINEENDEQSIKIKGIKGDKGDRGDVGPRGLIGPAGAKGPKGDIGEQGPQGAQGKQGEKGERGEKGSRGFHGLQGEKGDKGDIGPVGPQGPQGEKGIDGKDGKDGERGLMGFKGEMGPQGPMGPKGEPGSPGKPGKDGESSIITANYPLILNKGTLSFDSEKFTKVIDQLRNTDIQNAINKLSTAMSAGGGAVGIKQNGNYVLKSVNDINFTGNGVSVNRTGKDVTVNITAGGGGGVSVKGTEGSLQFANSAGNDLEFATDLKYDSNTNSLEVPAILKLTENSGPGYIEFPDGTTQGTAMLRGNTGATGPAGATGARGNTGATGPAATINSTTQVIDFTGTINYLKFMVSGTGGINSNSLQNVYFNTIAAISLNTSGTTAAIVLDNVVSYNRIYDDTLGWIAEIVAKPTFGLSKTADQLYSETFNSIGITWSTSSYDNWTTFSGKEVLQRDGSYVVKGITGQSWVTADSFITCKIMGLTSADHTAEDAIMEGVQFEINNIVPTVGFDIIGHAPNGTYGKYTVKCLGQ